MDSMTHKLHILTNKKRFPVAEDLYGLFFEDINRAGDSGLYPEMIRNRSFEDSLIPDGCTVDETGAVYFNKAKWPGAFNHGEGIDDWMEQVPETPIPGWYCRNAVMNLEYEDTLNRNRKSALRVHFDTEGSIWNIGYHGVPVEDQKTYCGYLFLKGTGEVELTFAFLGEDGRCYGKTTSLVTMEEQYRKIEFEIQADATDYKASFAIGVNQPCDLLVGFLSLMPSETYRGHGLRKDLVEMLEGLHPRFMRFPGGCVVEGLTEETAMRFPNTIGPVWERPSHNLMWHYRTTNGLGFHEYLQLCEDLNMEAMYVCNCGICCQARHGYQFSDASIQQMLQEALHAIEYAIGSVDSQYGKMRADAGHPEPFSLKYMEIGNENWGEEYLHCYPIFYQAIKEKYPQIILISNSHTEKAGLATEIADEHYYNTPEFFFENDKRFDTYDRKGPQIFLGEYAVNGGKTIASMECALAEAVFLTGVEQNQDIVTLSAYAPLFENVNYSAWKPNLIRFDNHQVYGIPSYHVLSLFGKYRGNDVVETQMEGAMQPSVYQGMPGIMCNQPGLEIKNAQISGTAVDIGKIIYGKVQKQGENISLVRTPNQHHFTGKNQVWNQTFETFVREHRRPGTEDEADLVWVLFGGEVLATEALTEYTFEADLRYEPSNSVTFSIWNSHADTDAGCVEPRDFDWNLGSVRNQIWKIAEGYSVTEQRGMFDGDLPEPERVPIELDYSQFHHYRIAAKKGGYSCYIDDKLIQEHTLPEHPMVYSVASVDEQFIYLKLVNIHSNSIEVTIQLDCEIEPKVQLEMVQAESDAVNSMENKSYVAIRESTLNYGEKNSIFETPAHSVNVLVMKKK